MNPINKIVSLFQPDLNNNRKKLIVQKKTFCSELNICSDIDLRRNQCWSTLNKYKNTKGIISITYLVSNYL